MAEKSEDLKTSEDKISQAKELFARGSRNYLVKAYNDAADDLSQVCNTYEEIYGQLSDELGVPYLMYAKTLIALAEDENKVLSVPEEENDDDDDDDDDDEDGDAGEDDGAAAGTSGAANGADDAAKPEETAKTDEQSNGHDKVEEDKAKSESTNGEASKSGVESTSNGTDAKNAVNAAEPGTSNGGATGEKNEDNEDEDDGANLQVAWELLELAVKIFERQGEPALNKLAEAYSELAGISLENSHFEASISDFRKSLEIHMKLPDDNRRIVAEIHYKIGLAHLMTNNFDDCIKELKRASELIDEEIQEEKQKDKESDKRKDMIKELEETKQDILAKITEVEETKTQSIEDVRKELSKIMSTDPKGSDGAGPSSSSSSSAAFGGGSSNGTATSPSEKPKPTDISHLIKRKKPDTATNEVEGSPAKKPAA